MIKISKLVSAFLIMSFYGLSAQVPGYYNGIEGKTGTELKSALHEIIKAHVDFSYSDAKFILNYADSDPSNENNLICIYTRRSQPNTSWGTGPNDFNREHVWAKSHGTFADVRPMDGDAFNLHPSDASVNITRSNYDFDECSGVPGASYIAEANSYYTSTQFEPQDAAKGEVARTLFYMAVRYEGTGNEIDLEMINQVNNYPNPVFGRLSTLLQWNNDFPPTPNERRRNERVFEAQRNRNPFIDNPDLANMIWGNVTAPAISIGTAAMEPAIPTITETASISATITSSAGDISSATLFYGNAYDSETYSTTMTRTGNIWTGMIDFTLFPAYSYVYYKIVASDGTNSGISAGNYRLPAARTITPVATVQGTGVSSPIVGTTVTVAGIVTANLDNTYYIQSSNDPYSGMCVFDIRRGRIGDSVVVTGNVSEYNTLTEIDKLSYFYNYGQIRKQEPKVLSISQVNESYEGMLVKFENVTFLDGDKIIPLSVSTNLSFTDGSSSMIVYARYNSRISGKLLPSGSVDVTGVISQYGGVYQLLINDISDIKAGFDNQAPIIGTVIANDKDWIEVSFNEKIDKTTAENIANYSLTSGINIVGAYLYGGTKVLLLVTGMQAIDYTLTVSGVKDLQGNSMAGSSKVFHSFFSDPLYKPLTSLNDTFSVYQQSLLNMNVLENDTVPVNIVVSIVRQPESGTVSIESDMSLKYEMTGTTGGIIRDTIIYRVCYTNDPVNCTEAKVFITMDFNISVKNQPGQKITLYPNPVYNELQIQSENIVSKIEIYDMTGKSLVHHVPLKNRCSVLMPSAKGLYFIKVTMDTGETITRKIVRL